MAILFKSIFQDLAFLAFREFSKTNQLSDINLHVKKVPLQWFVSLKHFQTSSTILAHSVTQEAQIQIPTGPNFEDL